MVESARTNITAVTVARICDGFGVDVSELYAPAPPLPKPTKGRPRKHDGGTERSAGDDASAPNEGR